jgi:hypothetical protein
MSAEKAGVRMRRWPQVLLNAMLQMRKRRSEDAGIVPARSGDGRYDRSRFAASGQYCAGARFVTTTIRFCHYLPERTGVGIIGNHGDAASHAQARQRGIGRLVVRGRPVSQPARQKCSM